jgi:hypothetical protein
MPGGHLQVAIAVLGRHLFGFQQQHFQVTLHRCERRTQVVGDIGKQLAPLLVHL